MMSGLRKRSLERVSSHNSVLQFISIKVVISMSITTYLTSTGWIRSNYTHHSTELPIFILYIWITVRLMGVIIQEGNPF